MPSSTPTARYSTPAIVLHWALALAILGMLSVGVYMVELPMSMQRLKLYNWHKWAGITILVLSAARLLWRLYRPPPAEAAAPAWQQAAARWAHRTMYVLFFALPLSGWAYSSASGFPVVWFAVLQLPDFVPVDRELAAVFKGLHCWLAWALSALVLMHVAAAFKHHFVDRDGLLMRMGWPVR